MVARDNQSCQRVLHVLYAMRTGGIEMWLAQVLRYIDRDRFHIDLLVHILEPSPYSDTIRNLGSQIFLCPHPRHFIWQPWIYERTFKQILHNHGPYDIVHAHAAAFNGYILRMARQVGVPIRIAHSHDNTLANDAQANIFRRWYINAMKGLIARHATLGLGVSCQASAYLFGIYWKADPRWQVLHCGIDLAPFQSSASTNMRAELGIPIDALVIGHVSRLCHQKNCLFLIDILAEVIKQNPKAYLLLIGDGPLRQDIESKVYQMNLTKHVIMTGTRSDVPCLMRGTMDIFLFPSLHEGLGLALVEAQAAGLPCVLSDVIPEEADVVKPLMQRIALSEPASVWAEATLAAARMESSTVRTNALALVERSSFNIQMSVRRLAEIYESNFASR